MSLVSEFKAFAMRGNVIDLAVGVVIGGAFGKIVSSLVGDIIMPPLNLVTAKSGINFKQLALQSSLELPKLDAAGKPVLDEAGKQVMEMKQVDIINYGNFLQNIVDFLIVAFAIFMAIKLLNSMQKKAEAAPAPPAEDVVLLREIRDALQKNAPRRVE